MSFGAANSSVGSGDGGAAASACTARTLAAGSAILNAPSASARNSLELMSAL
jgi:hypothetical protein